MRHTVAGVASLLAVLLVGLASAVAEEYREPAGRTRTSVGIFIAGADRGVNSRDPYGIRVIGPRVGVRVHGNQWIVAALGWGSFRSSAGTSQIDSAVWDGQVAFAYQACTESRVRLCAVPAAGVGVQRGWIEYFDSFARDDPWTDTITRAYVEGRLAGSALIGGRVSLNLSIGLRPIVLGPESGHFAVVLAAGVDVEL